jgi:uncharacterized protein (TIGR02099 family)
MAARLRWLARAVAGLVIAAWSLLLVAWLTLHWGILPHIQQWRPQIEARASHALGVPVRIGNIVVRSSGWIPTLELKDVVLLDTQSRPALTLPRVVAALSARSLLTLQLRFDQLLIEGAQLDARRDAQGHVFVAGLDIGGPGGGDSDVADWFFRQPEFVVRGGSLRWTDEQRAAPALALTDLQLVVRNGLRHHDMRLDATPPPAWGERFSLRARFTQPLLTDSGDWHRWSGTIYADLPRADVSQLRRYLTLPFDLSEGDGAVRAWLDVDNGHPRGATADVALREVTLRLGADMEPLALAQIVGRLGGRHDDEGWALSARQFGFVTSDGIRWPRSDFALRWLQRAGGPALGGELSAQRLDLGLMAQVASRVPLGDTLRRLLAGLNPQGVLTDLTSQWRGPLDAPASYRVKGRLSALSMAAKPSDAPDGVGRPGLRNADIILAATDKGGAATLSMNKGAIELPGVFEQPLLDLDRFNATLQWQVKSGRTPNAAPRVELQAKNVTFANADAQGDLSAQWSTGDGDGFARGGRYPGQIALNGHVTHGVATRVARYLPLGIPEETRRYVAHAVRGGKVRDITFRVKGDLWDFPFHRVHGPQDEFHIAAQVEDVDFAYVPDMAASGAPAAAAEPPWPAFSKVRGELVFDRASMEIRNAQAHVYGMELNKVQGRIRNLLDHPVLTIDGRGRGPLQDMLRYVNGSPVGRWTNHALAAATGSGVAELQLGLNIPLDQASRSTVKGSVVLGGNDLRITPDTPRLGAARARVAFTEHGFTVAGASARILGGDASFGGGMQADGSVRFSGQGQATAEGLRGASELGVLSRLAGSLEGQAGYRLSLAVADGHTELDIASDLVGMASTLPAPLQKSAEAPLPLHYQTRVARGAPGADPGVRDNLSLDLGDIVQARFVRDVSGGEPRVLRGGIGVRDVLPTPASGVAANIRVDHLNIDAWRAVAGKLGEATGSETTQGNGGAPAADGSGYMPTTFALRAGELMASSRRLNHVVAGVTREDGLWRANLDAEQLNGYVEYRPPQRTGASGRVYARLSRLSLPENEADSVDELLAPSSTASVPALDIVVDDFELRGKQLGRVEIQALNRTQGEGSDARREWRLTRLAMTTPEARFVADGQWAPTGAAGQRRTLLNFKLEVADSGALLTRLGTPHAVKGGKGSLAGQLAWLGSPLSLDYPTLSGQINVTIDSGQFLKVQPGAARLLSVLSLQSLPRRLALDFRDLFQEGFAFDNITGDVSVAQGVAHTNNLRMRGVQAAVLMEGSADIDRETQDLRVVVVPEINAGTASLAYAVINPAVGLGTFLAQMFLRKPLTQAGTREFHVTGPWSDPQVERVQRKPGEAVPDIGGATPADGTKR